MFSNLNDKTSFDKLKDVIETPKKKSVIKATLLSTMLEDYKNDNVLLFTVDGLATRNGLNSKVVQTTLQKMRASGLVGCNKNCKIRNGKFEVTINSNIWFLTAAGVRYASDREIDFEPVTGEYIMIVDSKRNMPVTEFILEIDADEYK